MLETTLTMKNFLSQKKTQPNILKNSLKNKFHFATKCSCKGQSTAKPTCFFLTLRRSSPHIYGGDYAFGSVRSNAKPRKVLLLGISMTKYRHYIHTVFHFPVAIHRYEIRHSAHAIKARDDRFACQVLWRERQSERLLFRSRLLMFLRIQRMGADHPTEKLRKVPSVRNPKPPKCHECGRTETKPNGCQLTTTFGLRYFRLILLKRAPAR